LKEFRKNRAAFFGWNHQKSKLCTGFFFFQLAISKFPHLLHQFNNPQGHRYFNHVLYVISDFYDDATTEDVAAKT